MQSKHTQYIRRLKVYDKLFCRGGRFMCHTRYTISLPEIRLVGKWLLDCGFEPGQHIRVVTEHNKLIITPVQPDKK